VKDTKPNTVLLIGMGGLGSIILELLAREPGLGRIVVAGLNEERALQRCNLARLSAMAQGHAPVVTFVPFDLNRKNMVIQAVLRAQPDLILNTATRQDWWLPDLLPPQEAARIWSAGSGVWLPVHMTLTLKLMQALRDAQYKGPVITTPFPDVINPVLSKLGLAPKCGIGSLAEIVPKLRLLAAHRLRVESDEVEIHLVAHHALTPFALGERAGEAPPYFLRIEHAGRDVTQEVDGHTLLRAPHRISPRPETHFLTAGSAVRLVRALLSDEDTRLHAPAPNGLPGGYPILAGNRRVELALPEGLSQEAAIDINERSHRFDGIESIEDDGTVVFSDAAADVLRDELGYDCRRLPPGEADARARELMERFRQYAARLGVALP
jgi:hypothetical protein